MKKTKKLLALILALSLSLTMVLIGGLTTSAVYDEDIPAYSDDPMSYNNQVLHKDRNNYGSFWLYPGDYMVFDVDESPINKTMYKGYSSIGPLWNDLDNKHTSSVHHEDIYGNTKYFYSEIGLSPDADYILEIRTGSIGGANLPAEDFPGWCAIEATATKIPLATDINYDLDGGKYFGTDKNPKKVLTLQYPYGSLIFKSKPYKEGHHFAMFQHDRITYDYNYEGPSETYPCGRIRILGEDTDDGKKVDNLLAYWSWGGTITYHTNGGKLNGYADLIEEIDVSTKTAIKKIDISNKKPVRDGYNFDGWYADAELTKKVENFADDANYVVNPNNLEDYKCHLYAKWKVASKTSIANATVTGIVNKVYSGKGRLQTPTIKIGTKTLVKDTDYKLTHSNNKYVGTATLKITGIGKYKDTITKTFKIIPKGTTISSLTKATKAFTVKWAKQSTQTSGYQIQYSTSSTFASGNKLVTISKNSTTSKKISKLKAKKKYYVRIRTYKTVSGVKYYSSWSAKKYVTTK